MLTTTDSREFGLVLCGQTQPGLGLATQVGLSLGL